MAQKVGTVSGNDFGMFVGGVFIGCTTSIGFSLTREVIESVCRTATGTATRSKKSGSLDGEFTVSGNWRFDATYGVTDILTAMLAGTEVTVRFSVDDVGNEYLEASCFITACSGTADIDTDTVFDTTFSMNGDPTMTVQV